MAPLRGEEDGLSCSRAPVNLEMVVTVRDLTKEVKEKPSRVRSSQPLGSEMAQGNLGQTSRCSEVKRSALNLKHSPEKAA